MGQLIEFYRPAPKPVLEEPVVAADPDKLPAAELIKQLLEKASTIDDVVILMCDTDGQLGFVTNLDGMAESVLFIERVKHRILSQDRTQTSPKGTA